MRQIQREQIVKNWESLEAVFRKLNESVLGYVVIRNFEDLPWWWAEGHGDIDFLCDAPEAFNRLLDTASRNANAGDLTHRKIIIAGAELPIDVRYVGDEYYDAKWEAAIIKNRVMHNDALYVPAPEDYYYSLCYHACLQKQTVSSDYMQKLNSLREQLGLDPQTDHLQLTYAYMRRMGYRITIPDSLATYLNIHRVDKGLLKKDRLKMARRVFYKAYRKITG